ncbi:MAG: hypothetical protein ACRDBM_08140 [Sporomusa sp.]
MLRGYLLRCTDCGYLYVCETEAMDCLTDRVCEHCGSSDMEVIQQAEGRFGCTSRLNTHVYKIPQENNHPDPVKTSR